MNIYVYRLVNEENEVLSQVVVDEPNDNLCIGGKGNDGKYYQYDSYEAYYSAAHFENLKVGLRIVSTTVDVPDALIEAEFKKLKVR